MDDRARPDAELDVEQLPLKRAVALKYEAPAAPTVIAKGEGLLAEAIIEAARANGVFVEDNPLLAEALGAAELDEEIPVELYEAVAEIIGFVLSLEGETPLPNTAAET